MQVYNVDGRQSFGGLFLICNVFLYLLIFLSDCARCHLRCSDLSICFNRTPHWSVLRLSGQYMHGVRVRVRVCGHSIVAANQRIVMMNCLQNTNIRSIYLTIWCEYIGQITHFSVFGCAVCDLQIICCPYTTLYSLYSVCWYIYAYGRCLIIAF